MPRAGVDLGVSTIPTAWEWVPRSDSGGAPDSQSPLAEEESVLRILSLISQSTTLQWKVTHSRTGWQYKLDLMGRKKERAQNGVAREGGGGSGKVDRG